MQYVCSHCLRDVYDRFRMSIRCQTAPRWPQLPLILDAAPRLVRRLDLLWLQRRLMEPEQLAAQVQAILNPTVGVTGLTVRYVETLPTTRCHGAAGCYAVEQGMPTIFITQYALEDQFETVKKKTDATTRHLTILLLHELGHCLQRINGDTTDIYGEVDGSTEAREMVANCFVHAVLLNALPS